MKVGVASVAGFLVLLSSGVAAAQGEDDDTEPLVVAAPDEEPEPAPSAPPAVAATRVPPPTPATPTPPPATPTPTPTPSCPPPPPDTWSTRDPVEFTGSLYVLSGVAIDDFHDAGFIVRPSLDFGVSFGLGAVSLFTTASVLAIEAAKFSDRTTTSVPFLATLGVRGESWTVAAAGGLSAAVDNDYGERLDNEESLVSPRAEVKAGYRFEDIIEILGHVGLERRRFDNRDDQDRLFFGVSVGVAGH